MHRRPYDNERTRLKSIRLQEDLIEFVEAQVRLKKRPDREWDFSKEVQACIAARKMRVENGNK